jgi:hypothetical protein
MEQADRLRIHLFVAVIRPVLQYSADRTGGHGLAQIVLADL